MPGDTPSLTELLDAVCDRESFNRFVAALASEREDAERLEREQPERYRWGGALGWQNSDISSFLSAAAVHFEPGPHRFVGESPTWRDLAKFLWMGKIYE